LAAGLSSNVVGTGVENGVTYIDIRVTGTSTGNSQIRFEPTNQIAAAVGQNWSGSFWSKLAGGTLANVTTQQLHIQERDAANVFLSEGTETYSLNSTLTRRFFTRTLVSATTAFVCLGFRFDHAGAVDFTLRIGLPQLEQGAFATSVIPTTTTALTRAADVASVNTLSPWFNAVEGTIYAEGSGVSDANARYAVSINDTTLNEFFGVRTLSGLASVGVDGGATQWALTASYTSNTIFKAALAYAVNDIAFTVGGAAPTTDTSATLPTVTQMQIGTGPALPIWNGYLRRITYYPRRLADSALQSITA
jgi:hypothetical protein